MSIVALMAAIAVMLVPSVAEAETTPAGGQPPLVTVHHPTTQNTTSPQSICPITAYGHTGNTICEFGATSIDWGGGNIEYFVVGTDYAIWHIWLNSGSWQSMGGQARVGTPNGVIVFPNPLAIATIGTDNNLWCNFRGNGTWSGWRGC